MPKGRGGPRSQEEQLPKGAQGETPIRRTLFGPRGGARGRAAAIAGKGVGAPGIQRVESGAQRPPSQRGFQPSPIQSANPSPVGRARPAGSPAGSPSAQRGRPAPITGPPPPPSVAGKGTLKGKGKGKGR